MNRRSFLRFLGIAPAVAPMAAVAAANKPTGILADIARTHSPIVGGLSVNVFAEPCIEALVCQRGDLIHVFAGEVRRNLEAGGFDNAIRRYAPGKPIPRR